MNWVDLWLNVMTQRTKTTQMSLLTDLIAISHRHLKIEESNIWLIEYAKDSTLTFIVDIDITIVRSVSTL